jgi:phage tail protein X
MNGRLRLGLAISVLLAGSGVGCTTTSVHTIEMERVDQALGEGNRGFLLGSAPPPMPRDPTREIIEFQFMGPRRTVRRERVAHSRPQPARVAAVPTAVTANTVAPTAGAFARPVAQVPVVYPAPAQPSVATPPTVRTYTVQQGDSLWTIARKVYGQGTGWQAIYEANRDQLPEPGRLKRGMQLTIPELAEAQRPARRSYTK